MGIGRASFKIITKKEPLKKGNGLSADESCTKLGGVEGTKFPRLGEMAGKPATQSFLREGSTDWWV